MRIYSMTATFGKLENQTLTLQPGLNIINAPNEWGKSTWCAFLLNMLYGIDTKERTKLDSVADKDRYAPWSGSPMSGKIDLSWNGRDITIERSSNQRLPLGNFRAYETATGIDIPELTAANCGQTLLGVERNVFVRAGFLKLADLPVTQDDALRRRLNNLVTTGDETDDADKLRQTLRDLKNKCRSNRANGLIPEAEAQYAQLKEQLWELQELHAQSQQLENERADLSVRLDALENHKCALQYASAQADARQVANAQKAAGDAQQKLDALKEITASLPAREDAREGCRKANELQMQSDLLLRQQQTLPEKPAQPSVPTCFADLSPRQAVETAAADFESHKALTAQYKSEGHAIVLTAIVFLVSGCSILLNALLDIFFFVPVLIGGSIICLSSLTILFVSLHNRKKTNEALLRLAGRYPGQAPENWHAIATQYAANMADYERRLESYTAQAHIFTQQQEAYRAQLEAFAGTQSLSEKQTFFENALSMWQDLDRAQQELQRAKDHAGALAAMAKTAPKPKAPDSLTQDAQETDFLLAQTKLVLQQTNESIAQNKGRMQALGQPAAMQAKLDALSRRLQRLESYSAAIDLAQDALYKTSLALQRRFSPRITTVARELFSKLTDGRYQRITLDEDMGLQTASVDEVTLQELRRRSDGTIDQLYLALRLAVARELTPNAPLILDDALVRFDDARLTKALEILKQEASDKQVILFTCQGREQTLLGADID